MKIPKRPWEIISWDFIVKLPKSKDSVTGQEYNNILAIINKLTKWGYFILCTEKMSAKELSKVYIKEMFAKHKTPVKIISDQDLRFVLIFWEMFTTK